MDEFGGNADIRDISDIEYYTDKLMASLRVPKAFLGLDSNMTAGLGANTMTKVDIRYARLIKTVKTFMKEAITQMIQFKISTSSELLKLDDKHSWTVETVPVSTAEEDEKAVTLQTMVGIADQLNSLLSGNSKVDPDALTDYLLNYILDLPDSELFFDTSRREEDSEDSTSQVDTNAILNKIGQALQKSSIDNKEEKPDE